MNAITEHRSSKLSCTLTRAVSSALALSALLLASCSAPGSAGTATAGDLASNSNVVWLATVEGMSCALNCAPKVVASLEKIDGVRGVSIDFESQTATITTAADVELTADICDRSFDNQGYFVSELKRLEPAERL